MEISEEISISTKVHLWWTWLRIAARHTGMANRARKQGVDASSFESSESAGLSAEFEASLVAIAAVAFAMEALDLELRGSGHQLNHAQFEPSEKPNRGFFVAQRLIQAFRLEGVFAEQLPGKLQEIFLLRNESVHFESVTKAGTRPHPSGTNTADELTIFTLEASISALRLGREVIAECGKSVELGRHDASAAAIARELSGVLGMLDEVMTREGLG